MSLLETIAGPADVRRLERAQLQPLADEVRRRLIDVVSQTGGHIGAGLGVVELTVALCHCFDSPRDKIVWDVGHQAYPWKILTGRNDRLPTLRQPGGLSGFLRRSESEHDQLGAGHAGTGLSAAFGIAAARDLKSEHFKVVAVVGDGALTCGLPYEAMNNAGHSGRDIIMVLNDNGMSIAPNVGAINKYLGSIIASPVTVRIRERVKGLIESVSHIVGGQKLVDFAKTMEESIKNFWSPGMLFEELGFRYFGPIDGHNIAQMLQTFEIVKTLKGPRVVHVITEKGKGFPLPQPDTEKYHARAPYDPVTGELRPVKAGAPQWTTVFGEALTQLAGEYPKLIGLLRCALEHTGGPFALRYPRDKAPGETPPAAEVAPIRYGTWDVLRKGRECALLAVGAMCQPALAAAEELAADGFDVTVVNCRFLKPVDRELLDALLRDHRLLVTLEDGTVTNGFGASLAGLVQTIAAETRVVPLGAPHRTYEHAPRAQQLAEVGLTGSGIAARVRALAAAQSLTHS